MNHSKFKMNVYRKISVFLIVTILAQIAAPVTSYALTSGPSQPEVQSFEPIGTTEMVDLFTGDFTYNIPLFELPGPNGGYPFNLHYNSGISMDQEASWTGLGWNLNPGSITRQMRGLPDEYDGSAGDKITHMEDMKPNTTYGVGFGGGIEIAGADSDVGLGISVGMSIYYNSYKGVGYSIDQGLSVTQKGNSSGIGAGVGMDFSMDSQEGVGVNASLSLTDTHENDKQTYSMGIGFNSHSGAHLSSGFSTSQKDKQASTDKNRVNKNSVGGNSTLSFQSIGYSPSVSMPMTGANITVQFKAGGQVQVVTPNAYINGFYNTQKLQNKGMNVHTPAYGYLNLHKVGSDKNVALDFNREGDGMIRKNSPNLPIPNLTCDVYSVTAHGVAGMYRAFRNDVANVHDPDVKSETFGGSLGIEAAGGLLFELGGDASVNYSKSESGIWSSVPYPIATSSDKAYEPSYFKTYGEHTSDSKTEMDAIGGEKPMRVKLSNLNATSQLEDKNGGNTQTANSILSTEREPRNVVVNYVNNDPKGGMYVINADGSRYYYRKADNTTHIECLYASGPLGGLQSAFSGMTSLNGCSPVIPIQTAGTLPKHDYANTNEYLKKTSMPTYAYAYLIDYIVGPDYVDVDANGVSDNDMGYWVKFNYNEAFSIADEAGFVDKAPLLSKWRIPFAGANYVRGLQTTFEDDKGSYTYGEKKVYYLTSVESKTHVAKFYTSKRKDARGANGELQNPANNAAMSMNGSGNLGSYSRKLDRVALYSKLDTNIPVKSVYFEYTYDLCKGLHNNVENGSESGKLTLKRLWFTYKDNTRGSLSPYVFDYNETVSAENPNYNPIAYDRWGNYKPLPSSPSNDDICKLTENPYVKQFTPGVTPDAFKAEVDRNMAVWSMKKITLPSGAEILVDYEADDYAYVQNKRAAQMFEIDALRTGSTDLDLIDHAKNDGPTKRKVYFKLEEPIAPSEFALVGSKAFISKYFEGLDKLYFKVFMNITDASRQDYVSGYVDIDDYDIDLSQTDGSGRYTRGVITMGKPRIGKKNGDSKSLPYHPFSMAAWQYIRTDNPTLTYAGSVNASADDNESAALSKVKSMTSMVSEIKTLFRGFHDYAYKHDEGVHLNIMWGSRIVLNKSFIKLNSPDKKKYGGGCRVKKIQLNDRWNTTGSGELASKYGQVYDYTMEENGKIISSGAATYEPAIGGDENALKYAKEYVEAIPLKTNNKLFFEYPVNESYYPSASVGYRNVTVKSLATHNEKLPGASPEKFPDGILTTGATVHEFFTSKEFPVITEETAPDINFEDIFIPIPLIGQISSNKLTASQGYSTILNDMHGKLRKVTNYRQDITGNIVFGTPDSYVEYLYNYETVKTDADPTHDYFKLNNVVSTLVSDVNGIADRRDGSPGKDKRLLGQDYEFFVDSRHSFTVSENGGLKINTDGLYVAVAAITLPVPWPNLGRATTEVNTVVTNKIIHKSGIQIGTIAYDGGSTVKSLTVLFDDLTGDPLLTRVTNDFDDPIFNYDMPAHFAYNEAGPAYKNIGISVSISGGIVASPDFNYLVEGDELVSGSGVKVVYVNAEGTQHNCKLLGVSSNDGGGGITGTFSVIRSGRRNILTSKVGNIKTLGDKSNATVGDPTIQSNRFNFQY